MEMRWVLAVLGMALLFPGAARAGDRFTPGHVFVSVLEPDPCEFGGREAIVEIDPATGVASVFADSDDGICIINGLRFTPDRSQLYALNLGHISPFDGGWVQAFNPDGTSSVVLDASDGLVGPNGANGLAFDTGGNLYVVNAEVSTILKFPVDGGPATVFADSTDGIADRGALDFAPNGDLFYCGDLAGRIVRIAPNGDSSVFDTLVEPSSLAFDGQGNLFAGAWAVGATIFRYDLADPNSRRILASGFSGASGIPLALTLSPDGGLVYFLELGGTVYTIDAEDGTTTLLTDLADQLSGVIDSIVPTGITVYVPKPIPATSDWGIALMAVVVLTVGTFVSRRSASDETHGMQTRITPMGRATWLVPAMRRN